MGKHKIFHYGFSGALDLFQVQTVAKKIRGIGIENRLRNIAIEKGLVSLSSPLIGESWNALITLKTQYMKPSKWNNYPNLKHSSFDTYYNPKLLDQTKQRIQDWQQCCGYPGVKMMIPRPKKIKISYESQKKFQVIECELKDFQARIVCHELQHLESIDPLKRALGIQIIDERLRAENDIMIQTLFGEMMKERVKYENKDKEEREDISKLYKSRPRFNELRRQLAFTITEHYRK